MVIVPVVQLVLFVVIVVNWDQLKHHVNLMDVYGVLLLNPVIHGVFILQHLHQPPRHLLLRLAMSAILTSVIVVLLALLSHHALHLAAVGNRPIQAHLFHGVTIHNKH